MALSAARPIAHREEPVPAREPSLSLHGTVASAGGSVLVGAEVCLAPPPFEPDSELRCTTSDAAGEYRFAPGARGALLTTSAAGHESQALYLDVAGMRDRYDFVLGAARAPNVRGVVVDASGGVVAGALVLAHADTRSDVVATARTAEDGRFALAVPPGPLTLVAQAEAYASANLELEAPADQVSLLLAATSALTGVVVDDETGRPVPDVLVSAYARSVVHPTGAHVATDIEGRFRLDGLQAGDYSLSAAGKGWGGAEATALVAVAEESAPITLRVRAGATLTGLVRTNGQPCPNASVTLNDGTTSVGAAADANGSVSIEGIVPGSYEVTVVCPRAVELHDAIVVAAGPTRHEWDLDAGSTLHVRVERVGGRPIGNVAVRMLPRPRPSGEDAPLGSALECDAADGEFVCAGIEPGTYDFAVGAQSPTTAGSIAVTGEVRELPPVVLQMPAAASISVQVNGARSTLPGFHVLARAAAGPVVQAESSGDGYWFRDLPLGSYSVFLGPTSVGSKEATPVTLSADGEVVIASLTVPEPLEIGGVVLDAAGSPVPELWLHAVSSASDVSTPFAGTPALTNERGEFRLMGLIPGTYAVMSDAPEPQQLGSTVSAGERDLVLLLPR